MGNIKKLAICKSALGKAVTVLTHDEFAGVGFQIRIPFGAIRQQTDSLFFEIQLQSSVWEDRIQVVLSFPLAQTFTNETRA